MKPPEMAHHSTIYPGDDMTLCLDALYESCFP